MASINSLSGYYLAGNEVPITVSTDHYVSGQNVSPRWQLDFGQAPADGDTLTFQFTDRNYAQQEVVMTAKDSPDSSGSQYPTNTAGISLASYVQDLVVPALRKNYLLYYNFKIRVTTAIPGSPNYNTLIQGDGRGSWDANLSLSSSASPAIAFAFKRDGSSQDFAANHSVVMDVWMESTYRQGDYERLGRLKKPPTRNEQGDYDATFYIQSILNNDLLAYELPDFNQSGNKVLTKPVKRAYVQYAEQSGIPAAHFAYKGSPAFLAINGKLPHISYGSPDYFADTFITLNQWLTQYPHPKLTKPDEQQYLHWLDELAGNYTLVARLFFKDGTQTDKTISITVADNDSLYCFAVGYQQLGLDQIANNQGKITDRYSVFVKDSDGNTLVDPVTYKLDRKVYPSDHRFLFENNFGVFETIRLTGKQVYSYEVKRSNVRLSIREHSRELPEYEPYNTTTRNVYEGYTGYMRKDQLLHFKKFLSAPHVFRVDSDLGGSEENGTFTPVVVDPDTFELYQDDQGLFALSFQYKDAYHAQ
jgi:hypothetical protein